MNLNSCEFRCFAPNSYFPFIDYFPLIYYFPFIYIHFMNQCTILIAKSVLWHVIHNFRFYHKEIYLYDFNCSKHWIYNITADTYGLPYVDRLDSQFWNIAQFDNIKLPDISRYSFNLYPYSLLLYLYYKTLKF